LHRSKQGCWVADREITFDAIDFDDENLDLSGTFDVTAG